MVRYLHLSEASDPAHCLVTMNRFILTSVVINFTRECIKLLQFQESEGTSMFTKKLPIISFKLQPQMYKKFGVT